MDFVILDDSIGLQVWTRAARVMSSSHIHSDIEINFVTKGEVEYFIDGKFQALQENDLALFWAGMPHSLPRVSSGSHMIWVVVPMAWFLQWQLEPSFTEALLSGKLLVVQETDDLRRRQMEGWCREVEGTERDEVDATTRKIIALEVEAMLWRVAMQLKAQRPEIKSRGGEAGLQGANAQIERLTAYISRHYLEDVTVSSIAREARLHPNYAMQVFREKCGLSLWEYVLRLRISHAQYLLLTTQKKIAEVARESGFGSESRFYAAFEKFAQTSPRAWRKEMTSAKKNEKRPSDASRE